MNGIVQLDINGTIISATISMNAIQELGLEPGKEAIAVIQATEVMMTTEKHLPLSARNQLPGTVDLVKEGVVNGIVSMTADCGAKISATISMDAIQELGLKQGVKATAVIKATSVMIGIEE